MPLPQVWDQFIAMKENKADLAHFLTQYMLALGENLPVDCELISAGGFRDPQKAESTIRSDLPPLYCNYEEADTRIILHACDAVQCGVNRVLVNCRDTDVLLLLLHFLGDLENVETWMIGGTARRRKVYPIHHIAQQLAPQVKGNIMGFHAFAGCDTTSSLFGFGKKTCWKLSIQFPELLHAVR